LKGPCGVRPKGHNKAAFPYPAEPSFSNRKEPASAPQQGHPPAAGPEKRQALFEGSAAAEASLAGARSKALVGLRGAKP